MVPHYDWISYHAMRRPDALATVDLATDRSLTYRAFDRRITHLAGHIRASYDVRPGDRVAVLAKNSSNIFETQFACFRLGAIFVPLNWRLAVAELGAILTDCAPKVLIHDDDFAGQAAAITRAHTVPHLLQWGGEGSAYEQAIARALPVVAHHSSHDDACTILYTSGTTGTPKGAIITHGMNFWNCVNLNGITPLTASMVNFAVLPLFHTGGLNVFANPAFHAGGASIIMRDFDPAEAVRLIGDPCVGITHFIGIPTHFQFMEQTASFAVTDLSRLSVALVGGAPTPPALIESWAKRGVVLVQAFGMTETSPLVLMQDEASALNKIGSAGKPAMHTEVRLINADGTDAGPRETGELWVRGPNVTPGYWNKPEVTARAITDGWLHTGDAALRDEDGDFYIVDRWKDMYISGGENVYPAEVENVIYQLPAVAEVAVIGVADPRWGEVGRAIVVLREGASLTEGEVLTHCAANLGRYKLPRSVVFTDALPHNATGKVHKPTLRQRFGGT
ncbi:MAG: long-chain fatty acid--CoA ligase [Acetobacteraceae bacterium]|nr:long-chain fatty acid--CoA ligase [Acetobacteraceae bacterium]